ncbi:hypothetical protein DdX_04229 [Ditylenchus destructor]|uniref:Uncharacterized protein n=1 Tax=Ditylenchus destructor TaxID=166010 RepID=A0AAD4R4C5_9BILA|nr:hypothetical protein DdX_04229 [Ditylenchus destructor]
MKTDIEGLHNWEVPYLKLGTDGRARAPSGSSSGGFVVTDDKERLVEPVDVRNRYTCCRLFYFILFLFVVLAYLLTALFFLRAHIFNLATSQESYQHFTSTNAPLEKSLFKLQNENPRPYIHPPLPPLPPDPSREGQCPAISAFQCDSTHSSGATHDVIKNHQIKIDEALAEELLEEADKLPVFYNLPQAHDVRTLFKKCKAADSRRNQTQLVLDTISMVEREFGFYPPMLRGPSGNPFKAQAFSPTNFSRLVGHLQSSLGMSTVFHIDIQASDSMKAPFAVYLKINHEKMHNSEIVKKFLQRYSNLLATDYYMRQTLSGLNEIKSACEAVAYPLEYEKWTLNTVNRRWSEINFPTFFQALAEGVPAELHDMLYDGNFEFFIENPDCFSAFNDLLRTRSVYERQKFVSNLMAYLILAEKAEYLGNNGVETTSSQSSSEYVDNEFPFTDLPHRLECVAELRHHLPQFTSKLYWEIVENRSRYREKISDLKAKFHEFYRKLMMQFYKFVEDTKGFKRAFALEKLRNVGTTYSAPDWLNNGKKLEEAHKDFNIPANENSYFVLQVHLQRFSFRQRLLQLIEDDEYNLQRPFEKISSATAQLKYSRAGNWLQIPLAMLTLPEMKHLSNLETQYAVVGRQMATEVSKAIDSDGRWWFSNGFFRSIDKYGPSFSLQGTEDCYRSAIKMSDEDVSSSGAADRGVLHGMNDIMGISVAYNTYEELLKPKGEMLSVSARLQLESFVNQLQPYYCSLANPSNRFKETEHQSLLKIFLDSLVKKSGLFGCKIGRNPSKCEIRFEDELDSPLYENIATSYEEDSELGKENLI